MVSSTRMVFVIVTLALAVLIAFLFVSLRHGSPVVNLSATINPSQKPDSAQFKDGVLVRVKSKTPLTEQEKSLISIVMTVPGYQFSSDEIRLISDALKR